MTEIFGPILIGIFIGIVTNLIAWWILFHYIVPEIKFSPSISKIPTKENNSGYKYRFKLQNVGKRSIIDVEVIASVKLKGFGDFSDNFRIVNIPLSSKSTTRSIPIISPLSDEFTGKLFQFFINEVNDFKGSRYPKYIQDKAIEGNLFLEDVMSMKPETTLQIMAFGYDEFSGTRKLFVSKLYTISDIIEGKYDYNGLEIKKQIQNRLYPWERFCNVFFHKKNKNTYKLK